MTIDLPLETRWVDGDPVRMSQALSNLLNNAAKYALPGIGANKLKCAEKLLLSRPSCDRQLGSVM
ncbi:hypothetical protein JNB91_23370 [Rhizobium wenxiniae]|uniref:hypothetical protein n=1 Tax=Rhizobium wenxiniae TaxID=1737357 RepID=UPI001C6EB014|nr:hypothetical protein [Rhizobium wenxiniae]MBW9090757.1 hypothetical protein [Rhizobium wenxiniae]